MFIESLQKALDDLDFVHQSLRDAGSHGTATDNLIIMPLIKQTAELRIAVDSLLNAHEYDKKSDIGEGG